MFLIILMLIIIETSIWTYPKFCSPGTSRFDIKEKSSFPYKAPVIFVSFSKEHLETFWCVFLNKNLNAFSKNEWGEAKQICCFAHNYNLNSNTKINHLSSHFKGRFTIVYIY